MTNWNPELEKRIRDFGDYQDKLMRDSLNPKTSALGTCLRLMFRSATHGKGAYKKACEGMGLKPDFSRDGFAANMQKMIDLAAANSSAAADKLKKALTVSEQLLKDFDAHPHAILKNIRLAKQKNIKY